MRLAPFAANLRGRAPIVQVALCGDGALRANGGSVDALFGQAG